MKIIHRSTKLLSMIIKSYITARKLMRTLKWSLAWIQIIRRANLMCRLEIIRFKEYAISKYQMKNWWMAKTLLHIFKTLMHLCFIHQEMRLLAQKCLIILLSSYPRTKLSWSLVETVLSAKLLFQLAGDQLIPKTIWVQLWTNLWSRVCMKNCPFILKPYQRLSIKRINIT